MELKLINNEGQATASVSASDVAFGREFNEDLVHQVVIAYMANARMATRAQKGRSEVAKSTRKPFRQKGTGNARAGMASSPLWRGGGKTFPNSPDENFSHKVNKKMHRAGMQAILSELARLGRLQVVEEFKIDSPKTKQMVQKVKALGFDSVMVVTDDVDENLYLSSRNLPHVLIVEAQHADPVNLVRFPNVLMTRAAVKKFEEMLG
ncbi:50S ribosomal protein L4 [Sulfurimicrobium lacus]|uniref:Large ribosomal subunit protein uL4 n=1 Tax=Sulfurimicrobium lacus TaxID=2715678 RepID=A0A6F8V960_9PROT|nr:50S ribosomal protein L4 [Sulfurimicrobium lacus]BCB25657.1 50S ribosomal protein L4 [Sulfurimicrobium lacus]